MGNRPVRGTPLARPGRSAAPGYRLPQHLDDAGGWCHGSGQATVNGGQCPQVGCRARRSSLRPGSKRTDPGRVLEAAVAAGVYAQLRTCGPVFPPSAVPLDPEPDSLIVLPAGPLRTLITVTYPSGQTAHLWVSVELAGPVTREGTS
jgi:hypothetical protein